MTDSQLRDDLMTMLIAGHETTAAVLTWCLYCLAQDAPLMQKVCAEIDEVMGPVTDTPSVPDYEQIQNMETVRLCLAEALRCTLNLRSLSGGASRTCRFRPARERTR